MLTPVRNDLFINMNEVLYMKKHISILTACVMGLTLFSCSKGGQSSGIELPKALDTKFKLAESFFVPATPVACEYTADVFSADTENMVAMVEGFYGDSVWGIGEYTEQPEYKLCNWIDYDLMYNALLWYDGSFAMYKGEYSNEYNDKVEQIFDDFVYYTDFDSTEVTIKGESAKLSYLSKLGKDEIDKTLDNLNCDLDVTPVYAKRYVSDTGKLLYVDIIYGAVYDGMTVRNSFEYNGRYTSDNGQGENKYPFFHVWFYRADKIMGILQRGALIDNIKMGERLDIIECDEAVKKAEVKFEEAVDGITLRYARLEYTPTKRAGDNSYIYTPFWALYYTDSKGISGIIAVDAVSGEISFDYLGHSDFGDQYTNDKGILGIYETGS